MNSWSLKAEADPGPQRARSIEAITAGTLLILSAIAATAMVWARLQADIDQPTFEETLAAIDQNTLWYTWHGAARTFFGALLIAAASLIGPAMASAQGWHLKVAVALLILGGIVMVVSGVIVIFVGSFDWTEIYDVEQLDGNRALAGSISNTIIGLAIILMAPVQWSQGGIMKLTGWLAPLTGLGMVIIWWDSSSIHQISGLLFLSWILGTSIGLIIGRNGLPRKSRDIANTDQPARVQA
ncbi:MAG: hypothetical protein OXC83_05420 [Chloroflexi bacterium]|nr:hypothetical protein [Chloroflexota bacterium]